MNIEWFADDIQLKSGTGIDFQNIVLGQETVGKIIRANVTYQDLNGHSNSFSIETETTVEDVNDSPTGDLVIRGAVANGSTLSIDWSEIVDLDGIDESTVQFSWLRDGQTIRFRNEDTYTLTDIDAGKWITGVISYTDQAGTYETLSSNSIQINPISFFYLTPGEQISQSLTNDMFGLSDNVDFSDYTIQPAAWMRWHRR